MTYIYIYNICIHTYSKVYLPALTASPPLIKLLTGWRHVAMGPWDWRVMRRDENFFQGRYGERMKKTYGTTYSYQSKKSLTGPTEWTPKPDYLIALAKYLRVRWEGPIKFLMEPVSGCLYLHYICSLICYCICLRKGWYMTTMYNETHV